DSFNGEFAAVGASTVVTGERGVEQYHTAVESAVDQVFVDPVRRAEFVGCTPTAADDSCVRGFVESMGRLAWRRPLTTLEIDQVVGVAATAATELEDVMEGVRWATVALFTSPHFLYRPELGAQDSSGTHRFTSYELASKLAFLLWNTGPDDQLLDEAESQDLATPEALRGAAERMLDAPAGRRAVGAFAEDYMRLDRVLSQAKDAALFPEYAPALQAAMVRDMRESWEITAYDNDGSALDVFSTTTVVANAELAVLYGLDASGLDSSTFRTFELPASSPRLGILGKAGFLSQFANQKEGSPTLRGKFIREAMMCEPVDPPPGDVALELPEPPDDAPMTKRERLEAHRAIPACSGCHNLMDPMGLPLETFDAIGRFRTTDHGLTIDTSGEFDENPVADARELGIVMSSSDTVAACLARKYYSYAVGYEERDVDESVVQALAASFKASGYRFRSLILDVVASEAFVSVTPQL
ncbi:MAG TPA: DUF1592 domain-containing protein, partial [Polyangiaceae bacterium]|nr:DUF1592 domain-containing protein [Polyangiaceae bacterium]